MPPDLKIQLYIYCLGKQISICSPRSLNNLYQSSLTIQNMTCQWQHYSYLIRPLFEALGLKPY